MKGAVVLLAAAMMFAGPSAAKNSREEVSPALVAKVEDRFSEISGFRAKFRQVFHDASMGSTEESAGTVAMLKPRKMRWDYKTPLEQTVVSDGRSVYFYVPAEKRATVAPLGGIINDRSPALFLAGGKKLAEIFTIKPPRPGDETGELGGRIFLSLEPREKSASVTRIVVAVDASDYTIRALSLFDWAGNRSDIEFLDMETNVKLDDRFFRFDRPAGVELLEAPKF